MLPSVRQAYVRRWECRPIGEPSPPTVQIPACRCLAVLARRLNGELTDVFALQDEITRKVISAIEPRLLEAEGVRALTRASAVLDAWELVARASSIFWRMTPANSEAAIALYREAVRRYPVYAPAHSMLAVALLMSGFVGWTAMTANVREAADLAARAAELDGGDPWAHLALGQLATMRKQTDAAENAFQRALELNPNFAAAHGFLGYDLALAGQSERALEHLNQALSLSPHDPQNIVFMIGVGHPFIKGDAIAKPPTTPTMSLSSDPSTSVPIVSCVPAWLRRVG